jgi:hypothetical protein
MKTLIVILLLVPTVALACQDGFVPTDVEGVCVEVPKPVQPSDEKPPTDKHLDDYRPDVVTAPNMADQDAKADAEKAEADKEGKAAAGVPEQ